MDQRVERVLRVMQKNLHADLSLGALAQSVNLSSWRFSHVFRSEVGMSPIQYLRCLRMERAKYLLETSFLSVKQIAYKVGMKDESHFVRDFKKAYGVPPTPYRADFYSAQTSKARSLIEPQEKSGSRKARAAKLSFLLSLEVLDFVTTYFSA